LEGMLTGQKMILWIPMMLLRIVIDADLELGTFMTSGSRWQEMILVAFDLLDLTARTTDI